MNQKHVNTLDKKHNEMMDLYYTRETETLPKLQEEIEVLKQKVHTLKPNQIDEYMDIKDAIKKRREKIKEIKFEKKKIFIGKFEIYF